MKALTQLVIVVTSISAIIAGILQIKPTIDTYLATRKSKALHPETVRIASLGYACTRSNDHRKVMAIHDSEAIVGSRSTLVAISAFLATASIVYTVLLVNNLRGNETFKLPLPGPVLQTLDLVTATIALLLAIRYYYTSTILDKLCVCHSVTIEVVLDFSAVVERCQVAIEGIQARLISVSQDAQETMIVAKRGRMWTLYDYVVVEIAHEVKPGRDGENVVCLTMKSEGVRPTLRLNSLRHASNVHQFVGLLLA